MYVTTLFLLPSYSPFFERGPGGGMVVNPSSSLILLLFVLLFFPSFFLVGIYSTHTYHTYLVVNKSFLLLGSWAGGYSDRLSF